MKAISKLSLIILFLVTPNAFAQTTPVGMLNKHGFIDVFALRKAVSKLEDKLPIETDEYCETQTCITAIERKKRTYEKAQSAFMRTWGAALLVAIKKGDEVAEVIWRQCNITPVIDRRALASTCDQNPVLRKEAALRLQQIGFEAAIDSEERVYEPNQSIRRTRSQERTLHQMEAGIYGGWTIDNYHGGNAPESPDELFDIRRAAVISAASTMVRRSFTYIRLQGGNEHESHASLSLNRKPIGTPTLAWGANVFNSGTPYTGPYDPAQDGFRVYLRYDNHREVIVGGNHDPQYLRMLYETLTRSEQRINYWLKRDPRWSVFLLNRQGHHEWIPEGMGSYLGSLNPTWSGQWELEKSFVNFARVVSPVKAKLKIRVDSSKTIAQFEYKDKPYYSCELRYSGAYSSLPEDNNHAKTAYDTVIGNLPSIAPNFYGDAGPVEPFSPMNPNKVYRQVLVQCPQGEWPDNRNKQFLFLANDTLIEVIRAENDKDMIIHHWQRKAPLNPHSSFMRLPPPFDIQPTLKNLGQEVTKVE